MKISTKPLVVGCALATLAFLVGCTSVRPLSSTPPAPVITLTAPAIAKGLFSKTIFPAGEYKAALEDNDGYYYQAPSKIVVNDVVASMFDGGLYVKRGTEVPDHFYLIRKHGQTDIGRFSTLPAYELKK